MPVENRRRLAEARSGPTVAVEQWERPSRCKNGHLLEGDNVGIKPKSGKRYCRACERDRGRQRRAGR